MCEQRAFELGRSTVVQAARSVINGDVFIGGFERLRYKWLDPILVFEEIQVERFAGREWLLKPLHRFLADNDRGYFILHAGAGLGKTAVPASLTGRASGKSRITLAAGGLHSSRE